MLLRVCLSLALLVTCLEARVSFNYSVILDEFDFKGQSSVSIDGLCRDTCHIYASITPESRKTTDKMLIQTRNGFFSISLVADLRDTSNNRKLYLEANSVDTLTIVNGNSGLDAGPLVLYVVNKNAPYFSGAEVYEAEGLDRSPSQVQALTILSARPFTISEATFAPMGVLARLAGFDALGYLTDTCPNLYYLIRGPFPGFIMTINAPVVSLLYDMQQFHQFPVGEVKASIGISNTHQMQLAGFINSPGYHGCSGKPAYRSSLYDMSNPILELLQDTNQQGISLEVICNSDDAHALVVKNSAGIEEVRFHGTNDTAPLHSTFHDSTLQFSWTPQQDTYFMVRYNSTAIPDIN